MQGLSDMEDVDPSHERRASANGASSSGRAHGAAVDSRIRSRGDIGAETLPMLASACPGWVCYAEKTHGEYVLPYISTTRSPQVRPTARIRLQSVICCISSQHAMASQAAPSLCISLPMPALYQFYGAASNSTLHGLSFTALCNSQGWMCAGDHGQLGKASLGAAGRRGCWGRVSLRRHALR